MATQMLQEYLDQHNVKYLLLRHPPAFTAQEVAARAHISGKHVAKTVIVNIDGNLAMVVLPAADMLDLMALKKASGAQHLRLAREDEFADKFPGCEVGAIPALGNIYGLPVYASSKLIHEHDIIFSAGSHSELVDMAYTDFERLAQPKVLNISMHVGMH